MTHGAAPVAADLVHLRATDRTGMLVASQAIALTLVGLFFSVQPTWTLWLVGQVLLTIAFVQWFALLHECGHETLFRTKRFHIPLGYVAAFFSLIPFHNWKRVHARHHKWTGWQDVDPTTASLVPRPLGRAERLIVNVCWKFWIPLFSVLYRLNNFWNWPRLKELFVNPADRRQLAAHTIGFLAAYAALIAIAGPATLLRAVGLALLATLVIEDMLLLSQHTHVPQNVSNGNPVRPFPAIEQEVFTRSLVFPRWLSTLLLHIDAHELHHMYPFVPGYKLNAITYKTENEIGCWTWIRRARALPGEVFLFQNRLETGADI
ncbi:MAG TPA: fatty acid desaturase [Gemmatimonadaceae bacterium]|nr:fatty acid desaturase [Gemmatimonadaceae bacterium]